MPPQSDEGNSYMAEWSISGAQRVIVRRSELSTLSGIARPSGTSSKPGNGIMSLTRDRAYRGSWAEQRVVARLAMNRTRKATRITTTPPTVSRSQKSELSRASNSRFPVITIALISNSTGPAGGCSDHDHMQVLCYPPAQKHSERQTVFPYFPPALSPIFSPVLSPSFSIERRFA